MVRHNHQEDELGVAYFAIRLANYWKNLFVVVVLNRLGKGLQEYFFVVGGFVTNGADISELDSDFEAFLCGQVIELVIDVVGVSDVALEAEYGKALKHLRLMHHSV